MKKRKIFALLGLGFLALGGFVLGTANKTSQVLWADSEETSEPAPISNEEPAQETDEEEEFECKVMLDSFSHGQVQIDKKEGHIGDIVTIDANADLFYVVESVKVNGSSLVEDEEIKGIYKFALVEGENKIVVRFAIDEELLGKMSTMVEQASNKDWANLFSLKNLITLVSWILSGGLLITMVRYYIKDKKLEKKVEDKISKTMAEVVPEATKNIILEALKELLAPYFAKIETDIADVSEISVVLCRCFALAQENTPESRIAITKELSSLKLSDKASISMIEEKIKEFIKEQGDKMANVLASLANIETNNQQIIENSTPAEAKENTTSDDDGTQI